MRLDFVIRRGWVIRRVDYSLGPPIGVNSMTKRLTGENWDRPSARIAELTQNV